MPICTRRHCLQTSDITLTMQSKSKESKFLFRSCRMPPSYPEAKSKSQFEIAFSSLFNMTMSLMSEKQILQQESFLSSQLSLSINHTLRNFVFSRLDLLSTLIEHPPKTWGISLLPFIFVKQIKIKICFSFPCLP